MTWLNYIFKNLKAPSTYHKYIFDNIYSDNSASI